MIFMKNSIVETFVPNWIFSSNVYVISSEKWTLVVDPWFYDDKLQIYLKFLWKIDWILLTHGHWDHIRCVDEIKHDFPEAQIYIHKEDKWLLSDTYLNCSHLIGNKDIIVKSETIEIEGWNIKIWWYDIIIYYFPWHTDWWVMYYFPEENIMFMWDVVMSDTIWTIRVPTWNIEKMNNTIQKFKNLNISPNTICYPWHSESAYFMDILCNNMYLQ